MILWLNVGDVLGAAHHGHRHPLVAGVGLRHCDVGGGGVGGIGGAVGGGVRGGRGMGSVGAGMWGGVGVV